MNESRNRNREERERERKRKRKSIRKKIEYYASMQKKARLAFLLYFKEIRDQNSKE